MGNQKEAILNRNLGLADRAGSDCLRQQKKRLTSWLQERE
jgi:hypothetical protein